MNELVSKPYSSKHHFPMLDKKLIKICRSVIKTHFQSPKENCIVYVTNILQGLKCSSFNSLVAKPTSKLITGVVNSNLTNREFHSTPPSEFKNSTFRPIRMNKLQLVDWKSRVNLSTYVTFWDRCDVNSSNLRMHSQNTITQLKSNSKH